MGEEEIRPPPVTGQDVRTGKQEDQNRLDQRVNSLWARKSTNVDVKRPNWVRVYKKKTWNVLFVLIQSKMNKGQQQANKL